MTTEAWVFMLLVWAVIIGMTGYCFLKMLTSAKQLSQDDEG